MCNERSSRSHSVFILKIEGHNTSTLETCCGVLNLVCVCSDLLKEKFYTNLVEDFFYIILDIDLLLISEMNAG